VWVADHLTLGTEVAVKFILEDIGAHHPSAVSRFQLEASAAARIKSPHVVQMLDHGFMADGVPFIIMELLEGEQLSARLDRLGWLSLRECSDIVTQLARALSGAHQLGIVHRDIKPDNIFLCDSDDVLFCKLLDFGVAKQTMGEKPAATMPGTLIGTADYMSREQVLSSRNVDTRADLWSLAVVTYEMLIGDLPFAGDTVGAVCVAICNGEYVAPGLQRRELGTEIDDWFAKAFHHDPSQRFQTARELARTLRAALLGDGASIDDELSGDLPLPLLNELAAAPEIVIEAEEDDESLSLEVPVATNLRRATLIAVTAVAMVGLLGAWLVQRPEPPQARSFEPTAPTVPLEAGAASPTDTVGDQEPESAVVSSAVPAHAPTAPGRAAAGDPALTADPATHTHTRAEPARRSEDVREDYGF
jgi:serine/threonine-protein kinase